MIIKTTIHQTTQNITNKQKTTKLNAGLALNCLLISFSYYALYQRQTLFEDSTKTIFAIVYERMSAHIYRTKHKKKNTQQNHARTTHK